MPARRELVTPQGVEIMWNWRTIMALGLFGLLALGALITLTGQRANSTFANIASNIGPGGSGGGGGAPSAPSGGWGNPAASDRTANPRPEMKKAEARSSAPSDHPRGDTRAPEPAPQLRAPGTPALPPAKLDESTPHPTNRAAGPNAADPQAAPVQEAPKGEKPANGKPVNTPNEKKAQQWQQKGPPTVARVYVGDGNALELVSLHITVIIEGPRARTLIDHVFRNPHERQLEGTFEYPLPTGANPSYFAMFLGQTRQDAPRRFRGGDVPSVPAEQLARLTPDQLVRHVEPADWGRLQEARVVNKEKALETYEEIVRGRIDPALLEYASGNTFRGRVFPIAPRGYNRVLLAYEELLPVTNHETVYRFALPAGPLQDCAYTLHGPDGANVTFAPATAKKQAGAGRVLLTHSWKGTGPGGVAEFRYPAPAVQAVTGRVGDNGPVYAYARVRPELPAVADAPFGKHAVFVLDASQSEHPDRFGVSMKLWQEILAHDPTIEQFNLLTFNVAAAWVDHQGMIPNTAEGRARALKQLDGILLEGATDVSAALTAVARPPFDLPADAPLSVFLLSDGHITWGESDVARVVARWEGMMNRPTRVLCYRTGLGAENQELYAALTRINGGVFNCFTAGDLKSAAAAHRTQCFTITSVQFVGGPALTDVLVAGRKAAIYPGGELIVTGRAATPGATKLVLTGSFQGKPQTFEYPLTLTTADELAPRGWAEVAVANLLALNDPKFDTLITAYCQQFGIASPTASFLVLENEADYKRLNLEAERGQVVAGDLGLFLADMWRALGQPATPREQMLNLLTRSENRLHALNSGDGHLKRLLALLDDKDFEFPEATLVGALPRQSEVPPAYLAACATDRRAAKNYLDEAKRRAAQNDVNGAVRALSSLIEEHPGRGDALRLVGYRLLDLQQPAQAARLFQQVQRSRPFEPHSYRDLARSLERTGRYGLAALQYEVVLAGQWHPRFQQSVKVVAQEEYADLLQTAARTPGERSPLQAFYQDRLAQVQAPQPASDLRVTVSWNTDGTDIDLWVVEPDGTKCFYQHQRTRSGGELSQDQTQGYGPERYRVAKAQPGMYRVMVHHYRANPNLIGGETHVNVVVTRKAGTADATTERHTVILKQPNQEVEVCKVNY
jgi:tetratricopeptide (TPR) repeat protein